MSSQDQAWSQKPQSSQTFFLSQGVGGGGLARFRGRISRSTGNSFGLLALVRFAFLETAALTISCYKCQDEVLILFLCCSVVTFTISFVAGPSKKVAHPRDRSVAVAPSSQMSVHGSDSSDEDEAPVPRKSASSSSSNTEVFSENHLSSI